MAIPTNLIPLVVTYSFDDEVPVKLFESEEEAVNTLRREYENELRVQTEEDGKVLGEDIKARISDDGRYARIDTTSPYTDDWATMEWSIGTLYPSK